MNVDDDYGYFSKGVDFSVEGDLILTNFSTNYLLYITTPTIANMDSLFLKCFYYMLAIKLAIPVTGERDIRREIMMDFETYVLPEARRVDGFEAKESTKVDSDWVDATMTSHSNLRASWPPFADASQGSFPWG